MRDLFLLFFGGAIGAGLGWLWDDQRGQERRSLLKDRLNQAKGQVIDQAEQVSQQVTPHIDQLRQMKDRTIANAGR